MPDNRAYRFIEATEQITASLGRKYDQRFSSFGTAWREAERRGDTVVRRHWSALEAFGNLRNAIQHAGYLGGEPIAEPREDAVLAIERIAEVLLSPPQVKDFMIKNPEILTPPSSLADASRYVIELGLSQLPVYEDGSYTGLFTTNALARWLSDAIAREGGDLLEEATTVGEVLAFAEEHETAAFVRPTTNVYRVCDRLSGDSSPPAVLVTTDGKATGELQGIVTRFDVPRILKETTTTFP